MASSREYLIGLFNNVYEELPVSKSKKKKINKIKGDK